MDFVRTGGGRGGWRWAAGVGGAEHWDRSRGAHHKFSLGRGLPSEGRPMSAKSTQDLLLTQGEQNEVLPLTPKCALKPFLPWAPPRPRHGANRGRRGPVASWEREGANQRPRDSPERKLGPDAWVLPSSCPQLSLKAIYPQLPPLRPPHQSQHLTFPSFCRYYRPPQFHPTRSRRRRPLDSVEQGILRTPSPGHYTQERQRT